MTNKMRYLIAFLLCIFGFWLVVNAINGIVWIVVSGIYLFVTAFFLIPKLILEKRTKE